MKTNFTEPKLCHYEYDMKKGCAGSSPVPGTQNKKYQVQSKKDFKVSKTCATFAALKKTRASPSAQMQCPGGEIGRHTTLRG